MKKFLLALLIMGACAVNVFADEDSFGAGVWFDCPESIESKEIEGLGLGLPLLVNREIEGASLALCGNHSQKVSGFQGALFGFNYAGSLHGAQVALANFQKGQHDDFAVQIGIYNEAAENGVQIGLVNRAEDNATFQFGLICINKNGLLPFMLFINFSNDLFD